jgi:hypothetical protein
MSKPRIIGLIVFAFILLVLFESLGYPDEKRVAGKQTEADWDLQLNEMNYFVLKCSSVNLIRGLHLSREQALELKAYADSLAPELPDIPDSKGKTDPSLSAVRSAYIELIGVLEQGGTVSADLKKRVNDERKNEALIIKKTLLGAQTANYKESGCYKCHATPSRFPSAKDLNREPRSIDAALRAETDKAHIDGLFGRDATIRIWQYKDSVIQILSKSQQAVVRDFRCCLIPAASLSGPERIGQAAANGDWEDYLNEIRKLNQADWAAYKDLFLQPLGEIIRASLPGIQTKEVDRRIATADGIIAEARSLDRMNYEIQKESICDELRKAISIDALNGELYRSADERNFMTALFLLYFGSSNIYDRIIKEYER